MKAARKLTSMGADVRQIAKLLQAKAPPGHKLAYINDEEAALLKRRGGSGRITEAGIPSYELDDNLAITGASPEIAPTPVTPSALPSETVASTPVAPVSADTTPTADFTPSAPVDTGVTSPYAGTQTQSFLGTGQTAKPVSPQTSTINIPETPGQYDIATQPTTPPEQPSFTDKLLTSLSKPQSLAALGIGGTEALLGANAVRKARADAQQAQQQLQAMAAPYQTQGQQLQQLAIQGQLTPANQQTLQAAQAQLAQGAEARGGVGVAQAATQIANLQAQLLQNQLNTGIQIQAIGDKIAQGAVQTGIQQDQYINNLTNSYAMNVARLAAGAAGIPGQQPVYTTTPTAP